ncbi:MAG TPA: cobalamin-dependent protein [Thermoleophilia bacterium]|nr:cobalamin-dependent protein [Thermoleophilia bacterium]
MTILEQIAVCLDQLRDDTVDLVEKALAQGEDPLDIIDRGIITGMRTCGDKLSNYEYGVPELMVAGELAQECMRLVKPHITADRAPRRSKVVIATVQGDIHELGKNLVALLLELAGHEVVDLGVDVGPMAIIDRAERDGARTIALSSLMVTTMPAQRELITYLSDLGRRDRFRVIVGGAPTSQEWADKIGADGWAADAQQAVELLARLEREVRRGADDRS